MATGVQRQCSWHMPSAFKSQRLVKISVAFLDLSFICIDNVSIFFSNHSKGFVLAIFCMSKEV